MDGTPNKQGTIQYYVNLNIEIHGRKWKEQFLVTGLGKHRIILGLPWLRKTNPVIDWEKGTLEWRNPKPINPFKMARKLAKQAIKYSSDKQHQEIQNRRAATISEEEDEEDHLNSTQNPLDNNDSALLVSSITDEMDTDTVTTSND